MAEAAFDQYLVKTEDLRVPEDSFHMMVDFSKYKAQNAQTDHIRTIVCALLNSCGGVITFEGKTRPTSNQLDKWTMALTDDMRKVFPSDVVNLLMKQVRETKTLLHLLVKRAPRLITLDYGLYTRIGAETHHVKDAPTVMKILDAQRSASTPPKLSAHELSYGCHTSLVESENTEFKAWNTKDVTVIMQKLEYEKFQNCLLSLANVDTGGTMYIGITDEDYKVVGQILPEADEETLTDAIEKILFHGPSREKRVRGAPGYSPVRGQDWDVSYLPVTNCPDKQRRRVVIQISIEHVAGGWFSQSPQSFTISPDGRVESLPFSAWLHQFRKSEKKQPAANQVTQKTVQRVPLLYASNPSPTTPTTTTKQSPGIDQNTQGTEKETKLKEAPPETMDRLSWTQHSNWEKFNVLDTKVAKDRESILHVIALTNPPTFCPDEKVIVSASPISKRLEELKNVLNKTNSFVLASKRLSKVVAESCQKPPDHMLDLLSLDGTGSFNLWVNCSTGNGSGDKSRRLYLMTLARSLKKALLNVELSRRVVLGDIVPSVYVRTNVTTPTASFPTDDFLSRACGEFFIPTSSGLRDLQHALGKVLLHKNSDLLVKQSIEDEVLITLTSEQLGNTLGSELAKWTLIVGPPGSGKSLLVIYLCNEVFGADNSLVMCTNPALCNYYKHQGILNATEIVDNQDMCNKLSNNLIGHKTCVVFDDVHTLAYLKPSWDYLFHQVQARPDCHLFLVLDHNIQNYTEVNNIDDIRRHFRSLEETFNMPIVEKSLRVIHRNTQTITSYISAQFPKQAIACGNSHPGDDVEMLQLQDIRHPGLQNGLLQFVAELISPESQVTSSQGACDARHVAILVDGQNADRDKKFYTNLFVQFLKNTHIIDAGTFPRTGLVVDRLDRFAGLDARVVILVAPDILSATESQSNTIQSAKYRAFGTSRAVFRMIFVTGSPLDHTNITSMMAESSLLLNPRPKHIGPVSSSGSIPGGLTAPSFTKAELVRQIQLPGAVGGMAIMADGHLMVVSGKLIQKAGVSLIDRRELHAYDMDGNTVQSPIPSPHTAVNSLSCGPDTIVLSHLYTRTVTMYRRTAGTKHWVPLTFSGQAVGRLAVTPDRRVVCTRADWLWVLGEDGEELWGQALQTSARDLSPYVAADSHCIVVTNTNTGTVTVHDNSGNITATLPENHLPRPRGVWVDSRAKRVLVADADKGEVLMFTTTGDFLAVLVTGVKWPFAISVFDHRYLAVGTDQNGVLLYALS